MVMTYNFYSYGYGLAAINCDILKGSVIGQPPSFSVKYYKQC